jgi:O-antigen ligase
MISKTTQAFTGLFIASTALAPVSTKTAGLAWLLLVLVGLVFAWRQPKTQTANTQTSDVWLTYCVAALLLGLLPVLYWGDNLEDALKFELRLMLPALVSAMLLKRVQISPALRRWLVEAVCAAAVLALVVAVYHVFFGRGRGGVPSNAIPWGVSAAMLAAWLLPLLAQKLKKPLSIKKVWLLPTALLAALLSVFVISTRSAYVIVLWVAGITWLYAIKRPALKWSGIVAVLVVFPALLLASSKLPGDPMVIGRGIADVERFLKGDTTNEGSVDSRLRLWQIAGKGIAQSPLIGHGAKQRHIYIQQQSAELKLPYIAKMGHFHNEYLHVWFDRGLVGFAGLLLIIIGMWHASVLLARSDAAAALQMRGLLFMHVAANFFNVNSAHHYYGVMLGLLTALVFLCARPPLVPTKHQTT